MLIRGKQGGNIVCYQHGIIESQGLQLVNRVNLKAKFGRRLLYYGFGILEIAKHTRARCNKNIWR